jgi:hypothetical protein
VFNALVTVTRASKEPVVKSSAIRGRTRSVAVRA